MGAEARNAKLAGSAQARAQALEGIKRRRAGVVREQQMQKAREEQTGAASMFPGEAPGAPKPPGFEEAQFRRGK